MIALLAVAAVSTALSLTGATLPRATVVFQDTAVRRAPTVPSLDFTTLDVAGLRVGGNASDFEITAARLFGTVTRVNRQRGWYAGYVSAIAVNPAQCTMSPRGVQARNVGRICVTAFLDAGDVVRAVRIERVFAFMDAATFRATLARRYGAAISARDGARVSLGWGPAVEAAFADGNSGLRNALTAQYDEGAEQGARSLNAAQRVRITLQLIDASWAANVRPRP